MQTMAMSTVKICGKQLEKTFPYVITSSLALVSRSVMSSSLQPHGL